jgi:photosystem II stability/assembly factor-like uncharacterized protein
MRADRLLLASSALAAALLLAGCSSDDNPVAPGDPPARVEIAPASDTLQVGESRNFTATAYDSANGVLSGVGFLWLTSDASVFTVSSSGRVTAKGEGAAFLIVDASGVRDTAIVFVYSDVGWYLQPNPSNGAALHGVFFLPNGRYGWAVGDGGRVLRTQDAGGHWTTGPSNTTFNLRSVWFTSSLVGWAVGYGGTVMRTLNGGGAWTRQNNVAVADNLYDVCFANADTGWAVGGNGLVLRTVDGGDNWEQRRLPTGFALRSVSFAGTRDGWAVGDNGIVAGTHDAGATWFVVPSLTSQPLHAVWRVNASTAVAVGALGTVLRTVTTPDSVAWTITPGAGANYVLEGLSMVSPTIGFASGANGLTGSAMLRTDDGGQTWVPQSPPTTSTLHEVFFVDALRGWTAGEGGVILHTATGGI